MTISKKALLSLIIAGALFVGFLVGLSYFEKANIAQGSVFIGNEYQATTTDSNWNTKGCQYSLASSSSPYFSKTLGSIIVTLGSNASLYAYDATTTGPHSDHATTTIAAFQTTATVGTYTFDVRVKRGLCIVAGESTVGVASTTITTRP